MARTLYEDHKPQNDNYSLEDIDMLFAQLSIGYTTQIYPALADAIISGDYIRDINFSSNLNLFLRLIDEQKNDVSGMLFVLPQSDTGDLKQDIFQDFFLVCTECINRIAQLCRDINDRSKGEYVNKLFIHNDQKQLKSTYVSTSKEYRYAEDIKSYLVTLEYFDNFLTVDNALLGQLALLNESIKTSLLNDNVKKRASIKSHFLIKKILLKIKKDTNSFRYVLNYQDKELRHFLKDELSDYKSVESKMQTHYHDDAAVRYHGNFSDVVRQAKKKNVKSYFDIQILSKFYKDKTKSKGDQKLKALIESLSDKVINPQQLLFDKYQRTVVNYYLQNNLLSFYITNEGYHSDINSIKEQLEHIESLTSEIEIKNYFPYLYYLRYLDQQIEIIINGDNPTSKIPRLKSLLDEFDQYEQSCYDSVEWCKDLGFISYRLPFEECIYHSEDEESKPLFIASAHVLPNNYEEISLELDSLAQRHQKHNTLCDVLEQHERAASNLQRMELKVQEAEKKNIEILSIFSAIVLFVASSVNMFGFIKSPAMAITFMMTFGYCIAIFVLLVWLITRDSGQLGVNKPLPLIHRWIIGALVTFGLLQVLAVVKFDDFHRSPIEHSRTQIDSIYEGNIQEYKSENDKRDSIYNERLERVEGLHEKWLAK